MPAGSADGGGVEISVVIPVFNEEENVETLTSELESALGRMGRPFEVIFVDDRSTDGSVGALRALQKTRPWLRVVRHRVNCGESAGHATGFRMARGEVVVTMDGDLQNDPADIPRLVGALGPDVAAVCGVRRERHDTWVRRLSSRIANGFRNVVTGDRIRDSGCACRAFRRSALREVPVFNGLHRFIPTLLRVQGYGVVEMEVNHRPRTRGRSKYGIHNRLWRGLRDCFGVRWYGARAIPGDRVEPE